MTLRALEVHMKNPIKKYPEINFQEGLSCSLSTFSFSYKTLSVHYISVRANLSKLNGSRNHYYSIFRSLAYQSRERQDLPESQEVVIYLKTLLFLLEINKFPFKNHQKERCTNKDLLPNQKLGNSKSDGFHVVLRLVFVPFLPSPPK